MLGAWTLAFVAAFGLFLTQELLSPHNSIIDKFWIGICVLISILITVAGSVLWPKVKNLAVKYGRSNMCDIAGWISIICYIPATVLGIVVLAMRISDLL